WTLSEKSSSIRLSPWVMISFGILLAKGGVRPLVLAPLESEEVAAGISAKVSMGTLTSSTSTSGRIAGCRQNIFRFFGSKLIIDCVCSTAILSTFLISFIRFTVVWNQTLMLPENDYFTHSRQITGG